MDNNVNEYRSTYEVLHALELDPEALGPLSAAVKETAVKQAKEKLDELAQIPEVAKYFAGVAEEASAELYASEKLLETVRPLGESALNKVIGERNKQLDQSPDYAPAFYFVRTQAKPLLPPEAGVEAGAEPEEQEKPAQIQIIFSEADSTLQIGTRRIKIAFHYKSNDGTVTDWTLPRMRGLELLAGGKKFKSAELYEAINGGPLNETEQRKYTRNVGNWLVGNKLNPQDEEPLIVRTDRTRATRYQKNPNVQIEIVKTHTVPKESSAPASLKRRAPSRSVPTPSPKFTGAEIREDILSLPTQDETAALVGFLYHMVDVLPKLEVPSLSIPDIDEMIERLPTLTVNSEEIDKLREQAFKKISKFLENPEAMQAAAESLDHDDARYDLFVYSLDLNVSARSTLMLLLNAEKIVKHDHVNRDQRIAQTVLRLADGREVEYSLHSDLNHDTHHKVVKITGASSANDEIKFSKPVMDPDPTVADLGDPEKPPADDSKAASRDRLSDSISSTATFAIQRLKDAHIPGGGTIGQIQSVFGITNTKIRAATEKGFIHPRKGEGKKAFLDVRDVIKLFAFAKVPAVTTQTGRRRLDEHVRELEV